MDDLYRPLQGLVDGVVYTPEQFRDEQLTNFGRLHHGTPRFVVEPRGADDVRAVVRFAREQGLAVSTRGSAHSQSELGISRGGILLALRSMSRILSVDRENATVDVEGGVVWRDLVHQLKRWDLIPRVLTNNLGVTVAGTLSVAGIGVASFRHGSQGDNVVELDVVTGAGEMVTCGPERDPELFWSVIAGLGQVGIITRARLKLRRCKPMTRTYYLLYDDLRRFLADAGSAMDDDRWDHLESWASPCPQGSRPAGGRRQLFAKWFYPFHLTVEYDPARAARRRGDAARPGPVRPRTHRRRADDRLRGAHGAGLRVVAQGRHLGATPSLDGAGAALGGGAGLHRAGPARPAALDPGRRACPALAGQGAGLPLAPVHAPARASGSSVSASCPPCRRATGPRSGRCWTTPAGWGSAWEASVTCPAGSTSTPRPGRPTTESAGTGSSPRSASMTRTGCSTPVSFRCSRMRRRGTTVKGYSAGTLASPTPCRLGSLRERSSARMISRTRLSRARRVTLHGRWGPAVPSRAASKARP